MRVNEEIKVFWRRFGAKVSLEHAYCEINDARRDRAASSTVEALIFSLRGGVGRLADRRVQSRLRELDDSQLLDVAIRLQKLNPDIASAWTAEDVAVLIAVKQGVKK